MFYLIMSFISENPAHGPEMLGAMFDAFIIGVIVGSIIYNTAKKKNGD